MLKVTKMHALGNNYIYISEFEEDIDEQQLPQLAVAISDIRRGIGSDGLILIGPSDRADVRMRIFNADGSEAENCGNGLRCVAKYAFDKGYVNDTKLSIEYKTGVAYAEVHPEHGQVDSVTVDMGEPGFGVEAVGYDSRGVEASAPTVKHHVDDYGLDELTFSVGEQVYRGSLVSMGNPHLVIVSDAAEAEPVSEVGPILEHHPVFPKRINVEFVTPRSRSELDFRVWERGSGITYACGTGACASVAAGIRRQLLDNKVVVHLLGGDLEIELRDGRIFMTGEAKEILRGEYEWSPQ